MNLKTAPSSPKSIQNRLGVVLRNDIAGDRSKDVVQDDREIYNVTHHATDILSAAERKTSRLNMRQATLAHLP